MKFSIGREEVLKPLQLAANVAEKRQTLPILSNVLLISKPEGLRIMATDSEVEVISQLGLDQHTVAGQTTVPARKILDICKNLPPSAAISFELSKERLLIKSGKSRFTLSTLPADDFPHFDEGQGKHRFHVKSSLLKKLIDNTQFAMAQQDVRYYLNGMLLEVTEDHTLRAVATDGHRLATSSCRLDPAESPEAVQAIMPRKGILELTRLLDDNDENCECLVGDNFVRISSGGFTFTSKRVEGRFPDVQRKLPKTGDLIVTADRDSLKQTLQRVAILTNEKYRGVRLQLTPGLMTILANNPEQEEAEEELDVTYHGGKLLDIGFNVAYLLDALSALPAGSVELAFIEGNNSVLIRSLAAEDAPAQSLYVVMPMRL
ncbi:MAG: polymerase subunit beta [Gammaproteobacteria bacterium]|jgi:DNA polymerase-3 subunit beta|nr:polymerase subunit beta [Gammaproteobacteria bacterium]